MPGSVVMNTRIFRDHADVGDQQSNVIRALAVNVRRVDRIFKLRCNSGDALIKMKEIMR